MVNFRKRFFNASWGNAESHLRRRTPRRHHPVRGQRVSRCRGNQKADRFRGRYHVLLGAIKPLEGVEPEHLKMRGLLLRLEPRAVSEVILCLNPNT